MSLFVIADLHLSFGCNKPMDVFPGWKDYTQRLEQNWRSLVKESDTVVIAGDISWAMKLEETEQDFAFIHRLPGQKILMKGNHDYWWKSSSRLAGQYPEMAFLKNDAVPWEKSFICGTRGWLCPNERSFTPEDEKIYKREQIRLRLSLDAAIKAGAEDIIVMMHFPPVNEKREPSAFTEILGEYPVKRVVYGHLHGAANHKNALQGERDGILYELVAADYLDFCPKMIL